MRILSTATALAVASGPAGVGAMLAVREVEAPVAHRAEEPAAALVPRHRRVPSRTGAMPAAVREAPPPVDPPHHRHDADEPGPADAPIADGTGRCTVDDFRAIEKMSVELLLSSNSPNIEAEMIFTFLQDYSLPLVSLPCLQAIMAVQGHCSATYTPNSPEWNVCRWLTPAATATSLRPTESDGVCAIIPEGFNFEDHMTALLGCPQTCGTRPWVRCMLNLIPDYACKTCLVSAKYGHKNCQEFGGPGQELQHAHCFFLKNMGASVKCFIGHSGDSTDDDDDESGSEAGPDNHVAPGANAAPPVPVPSVVSKSGAVPLYSSVLGSLFVFASISVL